MIAHPRGSVARRPGFALVRETKDSAFQSRLLPFRFSTEQTHVIEMGRATVDSEEVGYFRFHTEGATLLQPLPRDYVFTETIGSFNETTEDITITGTAEGGTTHNFETGDPVVLTAEPTGTAFTVTFTSASARIVLSGGALHFSNIGDTVLFRGAVPSEIQEGKTYFVVDVTLPGELEIAELRGGTSIIFTSSVSSIDMAILGQPKFPTAGARFPLELNTTYYVVRIGGTPSTTIRLAPTRADALAGAVFDWTAADKGTIFDNDFNIHFDYRQGAVAFDPVLGSPYYCFRRPWGVPESRFVLVEDHLDHPPGNAGWWARQSGASSAVTFALNPTNVVTWTDGTHGLTDADPVTFTTTGFLPSGIIAGTVYYVRNKTTTTFQISESVPGPIVILGGSPSGTNTAFANGFYEVPHFYPEAAMFEVNMAQSNDVLTMVHVDRPAAELRRRGATDWILIDVAFNAEVSPPTGLAVVPFSGSGMKVVTLTASLGSTIVTTDSDHTFTEGEKVQVSAVGDIVDGDYVVWGLAAGTLSPVTFLTELRLQELENGNPVTALGTLTNNSRLRASPTAVDWDETYAVTALDDKSEESAASATVLVTNNLLVDGAYNTITWDAVTAAARYRVYKDVNGILGFLGETDAPTTLFVDDNIAPDLSFTPPILDGGLVGGFTVTFALARDLVLKTAHGLEAGTPVIFRSSDVIPNGIELFVTYYVLNPTDDDFQLTTTPTGTLVLPFSAPESGVHNVVFGEFPGAVTYFEQRRVFGGARLRPQDFWLTASSTETDLSYSIPTLDSDRIKNRLAGRERSQIRHAVPIGHLLMLTSSAEYRLTSLDAGPLTPGSLSVRAPTQIGCSTVAPVVANNVILFAADRGGHLREMGFSDRVRDYITGDLSLRASHLFDNKTLVQLAYHQAPNPIVWVVSSGGTLLGLSYIPEEEMAGWHEHDIGSGLIESCAVVAEDDEDRVYIVANRGGTRYVERMGSQCIDDIDDVFFVDSGITYTGTAVTSVFIPHLSGLAVVFLSDGVKGTGTVSALGVLTLPIAATTVQAGLAYGSELRTLPLGMQVAASGRIPDASLGSGRTKNINKVWVRAIDSGAFQVGPSLSSVVTSPTLAAGQLFTGLEPVTIGGEWDEEGQVFILQSDPLPLIIAGLTLEVASGG